MSDKKRFRAACPKCDHLFALNLDCFVFEGCESDPHYGTFLVCPACGFREDVHHNNVETQTP